MDNYTMAGRTYRYYGEEAPLYPFGYGLSYTLFRYSDLVLAAEVVPVCGNLSLSVVVENVGPRDGEEVRWFACSLAFDPPPPNLGGWRRKRVVCSLGHNHKHYCNDGRWVGAPRETQSSSLGVLGLD